MAATAPAVHLRAHESSCACSMHAAAVAANGLVREVIRVGLVRVVHVLLLRVHRRMVRRAATVRSCGRIVVLMLRHDLAPRRHEGLATLARLHPRRGDARPHRRMRPAMLLSRRIPSSPACAAAAIGSSPSSRVVNVGPVIFVQLDFHIVAVVRVDFHPVATEHGGGGGGDAGLAARRTDGCCGLA